MTTVFVVALTVFLQAFSISLPILNRWFYYIQIDTLNLEAASGKSYAEIKEAFDLIMDYLLLPGREFSAGVFAYSSSGAAHFADCKTLFVLDLTLAGVCGAIALTLFILHLVGVVKINSLFGHSAAFWTAIAAVLLPVVLGGLIAADFDKAFDVFHEILFPGKDNWIFNSRTDEIINVLPEQFFLNCAIFIGAGLVFFSAEIIAADCIVMHLKKRRFDKTGAYHAPEFDTGAERYKIRTFYIGKKYKRKKSNFYERRSSLDSSSSQ